MALTPGTRIGSFEIAEQIGVGGMGEVYRATDTRLGRTVAIKVLPDAVAQDAERLARFDREARTLASLNHPNIAAIYGLEDATSTSTGQSPAKALVMELIEGPTLADRIALGPIPVDEALAIAKQIAEALEAAHEQRIIHRDLKPANVKVRPDGTVKVLDFGLAKAMEPAGAMSPGHSIAPTITTPAMTQAGLILGTAAYMSPEQARGKSADRRADIWAFGCVIYEMLTGQRAFEAEDVSLTLARVLEREPDWSRLPSRVPPALAAYLRRALHKDPKQRVADVQDLRLALEGAFETTTPHAADEGAAHRPRLGRLLGVAAGALVLGGLVGGLGDWLLPPTGEPPGVRRFSHVVPVDRSFRNTGAAVLALAPDGHAFVFNSSAGLVLRTTDELNGRVIPGTESGRVANPFFSPDSQSVGFVDGTQLKRMSISGGAPVVVGDVPRVVLGASWEKGGTILLAVQQGVFRIPATGGTPELVIPAGEGETLASPQLLPDGDSVLFSVTTTGDWDEARIAVQSLSSGRRTVVLESGSDARVLPTGHLVYALGADLLGIAFDAGDLSVSGGAVPLVQGVLRATGGPAANYGVSADGTLVYASSIGGNVARTLVWVDRNGGETVLDMPPRAYQYPRISPDGTQVAIDVRDEQNDIWIWSLTRDTLTRLTFDAGLDRTPVWSPDGTRIAHSTGPNGQTTMLWRSAAGTGTADALTEAPGTYYPTSFSPDGEQIVVYQVDVGDTGVDVALVTVDGDRAVTPLVQTPFDERNAEVSPDGRWIAFESNESGQYEVYVRPFPDVDSGGRWQVSPGGGTRPVWRADGQELFYLIEPGRVMAVPVEAGDSFTYGNATELFDGPYITANVLRTYDVAADGQRFLMIKNADVGGAVAQSEVIIVENWLGELLRLVPTN